MRIGMAFSGGGVRSAAQLGVLQALQENGIRPEIFTGTSGGAIIATLLALGNTPKQALDLFKDTNNILDIAFAHIIKGLVTNGKIQGLVKGKRLEKVLDIIFDSKQVVDTVYPYAVVATNYLDGRQVIFSNKFDHNAEKINDDSYDWNCSYPGNALSEIVRASCSLPGVFIPKQVGDYTLVDGGLVNNIPSDIAFALGADRVISVDVGGYANPRKEVGSLFQILMQAFDIIYQRNVENNRDSFDIKLNPSVSDVFVLDTTEIYDCFERGYAYGLTIAEQVKKDLEADSSLTS